MFHHERPNPREKQKKLFFVCFLPLEVISCHNQLMESELTLSRDHTCCPNTCVSWAKFSYTELKKNSSHTCCKDHKLRRICILQMTINKLSSHPGVAMLQPAFCSLKPYYTFSQILLFHIWGSLFIHTLIL